MKTAVKWVLGTVFFVVIAIAWGEKNPTDKIIGLLVGGGFAVISLLYEVLKELRSLRKDVRYLVERNR